jgi:hypothetical protein
MFLKLATEASQFIIYLNFAPRLTPSIQKGNFVAMRVCLFLGIILLCQILTLTNVFGQK